MKKEKLNYLKVEYQTTKKSVYKEFDRKVEKLANSYGVFFCGSSFDPETKTRDLEFKSILGDE